jgi:Rrf2 family nitric oxide-sensitive transcriptional repressor
MRLTTFTDYSLRVLMYLGTDPATRATVGDIARAYGISEHHLTKVVQHLAHLGYVETVRGKGGGLRLARAPGDINVGALVRLTEGNAGFVECFGAEGPGCRIAPAGVLQGALARALDGFFAVLDGYSLADLLAEGTHLAPLLGRPVPLREAPAAGRRRPAT